MNTTAKDYTSNNSLHEIKNDLNILKDDAKTTMRDAATFASNVKSESGNIARAGAEQLKSAGETEFRKLEDRILKKPGQSVALAFCAGLVFSYVLGSRR